MISSSRETNRSCCVTCYDDTILSKTFIVLTKKDTYATNATGQQIFYPECEKPASGGERIT